MITTLTFYVPYLQAFPGPDGEYYSNTDGDNELKYLELVDQDVASLNFHFYSGEGGQFAINLIEFCYSFCKYFYLINFNLLKFSHGILKILCTKWNLNWWNHFMTTVHMLERGLQQLKLQQWFDQSDTLTPDFQHRAQFQIKTFGFINIISFDYN